MVSQQLPLPDSYIHSDDQFSDDLKHQLPPITIIHASEDQTVPYSSSLEYYNSFKDLGVACM